MPQHKYDVIVIGTSQGAVPPNRLREGSRKVRSSSAARGVVVTSDVLHQTMVASARVAYLANLAPFMVFRLPISVDLQAVRKRKQAVVDALAATRAISPRDEGSIWIYCG